MSLLSNVFGALFGKAEPLDPRTITLVDVRTPAEFQGGHAEGAINLPLDRLAQAATKQLPNREAHIVVYCQSGARSARARQILLAQGYQQVENGGGLGKVLRRLQKA
jgi:phage shock protein E